MSEDPADEERRRQAAAMRKQVEFKAALSEQILRFVTIYSRSEGESIPLQNAHSLLDVDFVENAYMAGVVDIFGPTELRSVSIFKTFPPQWPGTDNYCFPSHADVVSRLRPMVIAALRDGRLVAKGIDPDNPIRGKPFLIPAERWDHLTPDFEGSAATRDGKAFAIGITVDLSSAATSEDQERPAPPSQHSLYEWFVSHVREWEGKGEIPPEEATIAAARAVFGEKIRREHLRDLRKKLAPAHWQTTKRGRKPKVRPNSAKNPAAK